ncbi:MAG: tetratricopeptide repeat protein [Spirochaetia bacterium]|nr:tetratricopeptide repeat protein [Spirochaetota bacterium]MCX8096141.1 tetratricopeptide repeat protein [Spirochaetota bacterium]MDW8112376.1 tetratricopeptide repeat protein [Spirochaetia bacterium]
MNDIIKLLYSVYDFLKQNWLTLTIVAGVLVVVIVGILIYISIITSEEEELKVKFDVAYFNYINSQRDNQTLEQNFQNFLTTLQEISDTGKNYKIVAIANIILGDIYYNSESRAYDRALSYYSKATNSSSEFLRIVAIYNVAQTLEEMSMFDDALKHYESIYKNYPKSFLAPISIIKSAEINYNLGNLEKARELYSNFTNNYSDSESMMIANLIELVIQQTN